MTKRLTRVSTSSSARLACPAMVSRRLLIVVLAAGGSRRFEGVKLAQVLTFNDLNNTENQSILSLHVERLRQVSRELSLQHKPFNEQTAMPDNGGQLCIILGAHSQTLRPLLARFDDSDGMNILINPEWQTGLSSSVRLAADYAKAQGFDGMLLTLADQIAVSRDDYLQLIAKWHQTGKSIAAHYWDDLGVPAILNASTFSQFTALSGDRGAKSILKQQAEQGELVAITLANAMIDIDTKADLASWLALKE